MAVTSATAERSNYVVVSTRALDTDGHSFTLGTYYNHRSFNDDLPQFISAELQ